METVRLENLTIGYASRKNRKVVATNMTATLHSGCMTCLIGPNGVGKSTLLRTLSAFQPPLSGRALIHERDIATLAEKELARLIGVVLTFRPDVRNMTVEEMVSLGRSPYTGFWGTLSSEDHEKVREAISLVGISSLSHRMIQTLSDGERQKVMIAKALAQETPVIFLDEPTAFLDYPSKVEILNLLHRLSCEMGKTVFLSTHDLDLALRVADRVWLMTKGGTVKTGAPQNLIVDRQTGRFHFDS